MSRSRQTSRARRWLASLTMLALLGLAAFAPGAAAAADPTDMVLVWNANAVNVISQPATNTPPGLGQGPPLAALHVAMVQGAIYDAVNAIDRRPRAIYPGPVRARIGVAGGRRRAGRARCPVRHHPGHEHGGPDQDRRHADRVAGHD